MKFVCLGYYDENKWESTTENEINVMMDECLAYDDTLRANGNFIGFMEP